MAFVDYLQWGAIIGIGLRVFVHSNAMLTKEQLNPLKKSIEELVQLIKKG